MSCCCVKDLKFENGQLMMLRCNKWEAVTGSSSALGGFTPPEDLTLPEIDNPNDWRCEKATWLTMRTFAILQDIVATIEAHPTWSSAQVTANIEAPDDLKVLNASPLYEAVEREKLVDHAGADVVNGGTLYQKIKSSLYSLENLGSDVSTNDFDLISQAATDAGLTGNEALVIANIGSAMRNAQNADVMQVAITELGFDCSDVAPSTYPPDPSLTMSFEDDETDFFWVDTPTQTDIKRTGAKGAGFFANFPATSAACVFRVWGWSGNISNVHLWAYRENHDETETGSVGLKVEGRKFGETGYTLIQDTAYATLNDNAWGERSATFTADNWIELQITVNVGSSHAIGIRVDDVTVS